MASRFVAVTWLLLVLPEVSLCSCFHGAASSREVMSRRCALTMGCVCALFVSVRMRLWPAEHEAAWLVEDG